MAIETGGPAFQRPYSFSQQSPRNYRAQDGVSLRDYFAGQAMAAYISHPESVGLTEEKIAKCAYDMADAMLESRK